jgi:hypothetical protein
MLIELDNVNCYPPLLGAKLLNLQAVFLSKDYRNKMKGNAIFFSVFS